MNCYSKGVLLIFLLDNAIGSTLLETKWHAWKAKHGVVYRDWTEESQKRKVWEDNYNTIAEHNRGNHTYKLGLNRFADLVSKVETDLLSKLHTVNGRINSETSNFSRHSPCLSFRDQAI